MATASDDTSVVLDEGMLTRVYGDWWRTRDPATPKPHWITPQQLRYADQLGLRKEPVMGDGTCFFHAVYACLNHIFPYECSQSSWSNGTGLRKAVSTYVVNQMKDSTSECAKYVKYLKTYLKTTREEDLPALLKSTDHVGQETFNLMAYFLDHHELFKAHGPYDIFVLVALPVESETSAYSAHTLRKTISDSPTQEPTKTRLYLVHSQASELEDDGSLMQLPDQTQTQIPYQEAPAACNHYEPLLPRERTVYVRGLSHSKDVKNVVYTQNASAEFLIRFEVQRYGVLGTTYGHTHATASVPEGFAIVDPAGLSFMTGVDSLEYAKEASEAIYNYFNIQTVPDRVQNEFTSNAEAAIAHNYDNNKVVVHVVGPDFRTKPKTYGRDEALDELAVRYKNVLMAFLNYIREDTRIHTLRLLPVSSGVFSGDRFRDQMPSMTWIALRMAFERLHPDDQKRALAATFHMCIFDEAQFEDYSDARMNLADQMSLYGMHIPSIHYSSLVIDLEPVAAYVELQRALKTHAYRYTGNLVSLLKDVPRWNDPQNRVLQLDDYQRVADKVYPENKEERTVWNKEAWIDFWGKVGTQDLPGTASYQTLSTQSATRQAAYAAATAVHHWVVTPLTWSGVDAASKRFQVESDVGQVGERVIVLNQEDAAVNGRYIIVKPRTLARTADVVSAADPDMKDVVIGCLQDHPEYIYTGAEGTASLVPFYHTWAGNKIVQGFVKFLLPSTSKCNSVDVVRKMAEFYIRFRARNKGQAASTSVSKASMMMLRFIHENTTDWLRLFWRHLMSGDMSAGGRAPRNKKNTRRMRRRGATLRVDARALGHGSHERKETLRRILAKARRMGLQEVVVVRGSQERHYRVFF